MLNQYENINKGTFCLLWLGNLGPYFTSDCAKATLRPQVTLICYGKTAAQMFKVLIDISLFGKKKLGFKKRAVLSAY